MTRSADRTLYLMRHGETRWNAQGRLHGHLDAPLTPRGRQQALWQRALVADVAGARLSSPQGRAVQTAGLIFDGDGFARDEALAEIGLGAVAGSRLEGLRAAQPALFQDADQPFGWYDRLPDGEGFARLADRCRRFLARQEGPALIVSHGITLRMIWALVMGRGAAALAHAPVTQGRVTVLRNGGCEEWRHPGDRG